MTRMNSPRRQRGMTLVELMVSLTLGLFLSGVVLSVFMMSMNSVTSTGQLGQLQDSARLAMRLVQDDLIQVDYFADLTGVELVPGITLQTVPTLNGTDCVGGGTNNATFPTGRGHFRTLWAFTSGQGSSISCDTGSVAGSDVLQIKRLVAPEIEPGQELSQRYYFQSNVNIGTFYRGGSASLGVPNSRTWEYQHRVYYVRDDENGEPALYRHSLTDDGMGEAQLLVDGVERFKLEIGLDLDSDGETDRFLRPDEVENESWDKLGDQNIVAIRIHLLVKSQEPDPTYNPASPITFLMPGGAVIAPADKYRRKLLSSTVLLRNPQAVSRRSS